MSYIYTCFGAISITPIATFPSYKNFKIEDIFNIYRLTLC